MTPSVETRNLASRLLRHEAAAGTTSPPGESAVLRVYEKLRQGLSALTGVAGCRSLLSRALTLAQAEAPSLNAVQVTADGNLLGLVEHHPQIDAHLPWEGDVILIAQLLELLLVFMGEGLTLRLIAPEILPKTGVPTCNEAICYESILNEIDQLEGVSTRLEDLAEQHTPVTQGLLSMAGSVRNTATLLSVLVTIRSPKPN
jgi:hypothetical protein